ncbi:sel1 repeat family protein [Lysobacter sp. K5869]|uniref:tetratricopeptide repeat protein n=1 Tax=Lysobacter sp. K5869 TaxID=2820808 RepID=UPI001C061711|nr:hypothetical protein [Lysobacter sp. K5869]QWP78584.1 sel1 repeat family protein [Lysobacter sp. K5869]
MRRLLHGVVLLCGLSAADAVAGCASAEDTVATCRIEGQNKQVSICLYEDESKPMDVAYRFGPAQGQEELVLRAPLMDVGYLTASGAGVTVDETAIFASGDHSYRVTFGFRDGRKPDPSALHPFGTVQVLRQGATVAELACAPETIVRTPDLLLERMRERGRTHASDGSQLSNYGIDRPGPISEAPPCEREHDVDTCWGMGVSAARAGDLALALGYYDKSCDAGFVTYGCYDAGKLYLHNRRLRDYAKAYERLGRSCKGSDPGQAPYACKYLGWMHQTGIGAKKDNREAWRLLSAACFVRAEGPLIDGEGCDLLAKTILIEHPLGDAQQQRARVGSGYLAYLALAMGCTDAADTVCAKAKTMLADAKAARAAWAAFCDEDSGDCAGMLEPQKDFGATLSQRERLFAHYQDALTALSEP